MTAAAQLLVFRFGADTGYEGHLDGALERIEAGGSLRVLDVLFVGSDAETGERFAIDVHQRGAGGMVAPLIGFRLDVEERRRTTRRALGRGLADLITALGATLEAGEGLAAVLVGHDWLGVLDDAVQRMAGTEVANTFVDATSLASLTPELLTAAGTAGGGSPAGS